MQLQNNEADKSQLKLKQKNGSAVEQIKEYKELLDIGAITQEEFDLKKKELLNL